MANDAAPSVETGAEKTNNIPHKRARKIGAAIVAPIVLATGLFAVTKLSSSDSDSSPAPKDTPTTAEAPSTSTSKPIPERVLSKELRERIENWNIVGTPEQKQYMRNGLTMVAELKDQSFIKTVLKANPVFIFVPQGTGSDIEHGFIDIGNIYAHSRSTAPNGERLNIKLSDEDKRQELIWMVGGILGHEPWHIIQEREGHHWDSLTLEEKIHFENVNNAHQTKLLKALGADKINMDQMRRNSEDPASYLSIDPTKRPY